MPPRPQTRVAVLARAAVIGALTSLAILACSTEEPSPPYLLGGGANPGQAAGAKGPKTDDAGARRDADGGADSGVACTFLNSSRTNDLTGCTIEEAYTCNKAPLTIFCDCKTTFTCTCGNITTFADCSGSCAGTTEGIRSQCGVDTAPPIRDAGPNDSGDAGDF